MPDLEATVRVLEERVRQLEDTLAIYRLVATYGPAVDSGDDAAAGRLWTEAGVYDLGHRRLDGADAVADMVRSEHHQHLIHEGAAHVLAMPLVQIDGDHAVATGYSTVFRAVDGTFEVWRTAANRWELVRGDGGGWQATRRTTRLLDGDEEGRAILRRAVAPEEASE